MNKKSLTIVIPAYNEEKRLDGAIEDVLFIAGSLDMDYEVIVVNDGSRDRTAELAKGWAGKRPQVRLIDNPVNRGLGHSLKEGFAAATKEYVTWFPGDNSVVKESMVPVWDKIGAADIIVPTMHNVSDRPLFRRVLSITFTRLINLLFRLNLRYYNGLLIFPTELVGRLKYAGRGHDIFCEMLVRAIKLGYSYYEIPFKHKVETEGMSKAISLRNFRNVGRMIAALLWDIYVRRRPGG